VQCEIEVEGRVRRVIVNRVGEAFAVEVDGRSWRVDAARIDPLTVSLIVGRVPPNGDTGETIGVRRPANLGGPATAESGGGPSHEVTVASGPDGRMVVSVGATAFSLALNGGRRRRTDEMSGRSDGPQRITAPMPGRIARVLVAPGDVVHGRQPVVVVEAMKMENELRAGRDGTVAHVHVKEGVSVEAGTPLIDIL
jgi:biotin carboxyl carrier protein